MTEEQAKAAHAVAMEVFDRWNEVTGCFPSGTSWYFEIESILKDAVNIGGRVALGDTTVAADEYIES